MAKQKIVGTCHICGEEGELTFEHIPPKSAYNNKPILIAQGRQLFEGRGVNDLETKRLRRGAGEYTLCERCNNNTGAWYGSAYVDWTSQAVELLQRANGRPTLFYPFGIYPLRVIKQVVTMFFSVNSPELRSRFPYLQKFVLDKRTKYLPVDIDIYAAYAYGSTSRSSGVSGILNGAGYDPGMYILSEIAFPPFVYVLTLDCGCPDPRLTKISHFASYDYNFFRWFDLRFPVLPISTAYPADYRTDDEVKKTANPTDGQGP